MQNKTIAAIAYVTLIGWIIALVKFKNSPDKSPLVRYHLGQALGLILISILLSIALMVVIRIVPALGLVLTFVSFIPMILMILGIIAALNETAKPLPIIGKLFEEKFKFLNA
ncbi:DUF4870 domain-containing protein [Dinghuibacter silviterrae]|uniref:Import component protein n=1 Tax=Dinghuibacter silviterrae TaxID=1539049 RepID=A0A4R8DF26_9BACT|nr:DUF4870 domain-containing protein [Dinghuibacter silviterrae]TDW96183.1 hypothetical protein EDB95_4007 [Dinghuibacter silviterrae]